MSYPYQKKKKKFLKHTLKSVFFSFRGSVIEVISYYEYIVNERYTVMKRKKIIRRMNDVMSTVVGVVLRRVHKKSFCRVEIITGHGKNNCGGKAKAIQRKSRRCVKFTKNNRFETRRTSRPNVSRYKIRLPRNVIEYYYTAFSCLTQYNGLIQT